MPCTQRACNVLPDKPCALAESAQIAEWAHKKETIRLHDRARARAAKVCGRGSLARGWIAFLAFLSVCFVGLKPLRFGAPPPSVSACQLLNKHAIKAAPVSNGF